MWIKPFFSKIKTHVLPNGNTLKVKSGTQIIDRAWQAIKAHIGKRPDQPGSRRLTARIRSAQFEYWNRGKDLWAATGEFLKEEMESKY